jgi:hypothetical protein
VGGRERGHQPASQVWAYVADYGNDIGWRTAVSQMHPSLPGPARVEAGRLLQWRALDRQKHLQGLRLVEATGPASCHFTEVVEGRLLGLSRPLQPLVAWLPQRQTDADLRGLNELLEAPTRSGSAPEETAS